MVKVGDKLRVEIADIDNRGKISLVLVAEESAESADSASGDKGGEKPEGAAADVAPAEA